jgi:hypothetical protein
VNAAEALRVLSEPTASTEEEEGQDDPCTNEKTMRLPTKKLVRAAHRESSTNHGIH